MVCQTWADLLWRNKHQLDYATFVESEDAESDVQTVVLIGLRAVRVLDRHIDKFTCDKLLVRLSCGTPYSSLQLSALSCA